MSENNDLIINVGLDTANIKSQIEEIRNSIKGFVEDSRKNKRSNLLDLDLDKENTQKAKQLAETFRNALAEIDKSAATTGSNVRDYLKAFDEKTLLKFVNTIGVLGNAMDQFTGFKDFINSAESFAKAFNNVNTTLKSTIEELQRPINTGFSEANQSLNIFKQSLDGIKTISKEIKENLGGNSTSDKIALPSVDTTTIEGYKKLIKALNDNPVKTTDIQGLSSALELLKHKDNQKIELPSFASSEQIQKFKDLTGAVNDYAKAFEKLVNAIGKNKDKQIGGNAIIRATDDPNLINGTINEALKTGKKSRGKDTINNEKNYLEGLNYLNRLYQAAKETSAVIDRISSIEGAVSNFKSSSEDFKTSLENIAKGITSVLSSIAGGNTTNANLNQLNTVSKQLDDIAAKKEELSKQPTETKASTEIVDVEALKERIKALKTYLDDTEKLENTKKRTQERSQALKDVLQSGRIAKEYNPELGDSIDKDSAKKLSKQLEEQLANANQSKATADKINAVVDNVKAKTEDVAKKVDAIKNSQSDREQGGNNIVSQIPEIKLPKITGLEEFNNVLNAAQNSIQDFVNKAKASLSENNIPLVNDVLSKSSQQGTTSTDAVKKQSSSEKDDIDNLKTILSLKEKIAKKTITDDERTIYKGLAKSYFGRTSVSEDAVNKKIAEIQNAKKEITKVVEQAKQTSSSSQNFAPKIDLTKLKDGLDSARDSITKFITEEKNYLDANKLIVSVSASTDIKLENTQFAIPKVDPNSETALKDALEGAESSIKGFVERSKGMLNTKFELPTVNSANPEETIKKLQELDELRKKFKTGTDKDKESYKQMSQSLLGVDKATSAQIKAEIKAQKQKLDSVSSLSESLSKVDIKAPTIDLSSLKNSIEEARRIILDFVQSQKDLVAQNALVIPITVQQQVQPINPLTNKDESQKAVDEAETKKKAKEATKEQAKASEDAAKAKDKETESNSKLAKSNKEVAESAKATTKAKGSKKGTESVDPQIESTKKLISALNALKKAISDVTVVKEKANATPNLEGLDALKKQVTELQTALKAAQEELAKLSAEKATATSSATKINEENEALRNQVKTVEELNKSLSQKNEIQASHQVQAPTTETTQKPKAIIPEETIANEQKKLTWFQRIVERFKQFADEMMRDEETTSKDHLSESVSRLKQQVDAMSSSLKSATESAHNETDAVKQQTEAIKKEEESVNKLNEAKKKGSKLSVDVSSGSADIKNPKSVLDDITEKLRNLEIQKEKLSNTMNLAGISQDDYDRLYKYVQLIEQYINAIKDGRDTKGFTKAEWSSFKKASEQTSEYQWAKADADMAYERRSNIKKENEERQKTIDLQEKYHNLAVAMENKPLNARTDAERIKLEELYKLLDEISKKYQDLANNKALDVNGLKQGRNDIFNEYSARKAKIESDYEFNKANKPKAVSEDNTFTDKEKAVKSLTEKIVSLTDEQEKYERLATKTTKQNDVLMFQEKAKAVAELITLLKKLRGEQNLSTKDVEKFFKLGTSYGGSTYSDFKQKLYAADANRVRANQTTSSNDKDTSARVTLNGNINSLNKTESEYIQKAALSADTNEKLSNSYLKVAADARLLREELEKLRDSGDPLTASKVRKVYQGSELRNNLAASIKEAKIEQNNAKVEERSIKDRTRGYEALGNEINKLKLRASTITLKTASGSLGLESAKRQVAEIQDYVKKLEQLQNKGISSKDAKSYIGFGNERAALEQRLLGIQKEYASVSSKSSSKGLFNIKNTNKALLEQNAIMGALRNTAIQYFGITAVKSFATEVANVTGELEKQHKALGVILDNGLQAGELFGKVQSLSQKSPFTFEQLLKSVRSLSAFDIKTSELYDTMKSLSDISAGLSIDVGRLILSFGHVKSFGYLSGIQLKQFETAGVDIVGELVKYYNQKNRVEGKSEVGRGEVRGMVKKREIKFDDVKNVILGLADEGGKFENMQEHMYETVGGKLDNLRNNYKIMLNEIGQGSHGILASAVDSINFLTEHWQQAAVALVAMSTSWGMNTLAAKANAAAVTVSSDAVRNKILSTREAEIAELLQISTERELTETERTRWNTLTSINKETLLLAATTGAYTEAMLVADVAAKKLSKDEAMFIANQMGWKSVGKEIEKTQQKVSKFGAAWNGFKKSFSGIGSTIASFLSPANMAIMGIMALLTSAIQRFSDLRKQARDAEEGAEDSIKLASKVTGIISDGGLGNKFNKKELEGGAVKYTIKPKLDKKEISNLLNDLMEELESVSADMKIDLLDINKFETDSKRAEAIMDKLHSYKQRLFDVDPSGFNPIRAIEGTGGIMTRIFGIGTWTEFFDEDLSVNLKDWQDKENEVADDITELNKNFNLYKKAVQSYISQATSPYLTQSMKDAVKNSFDKINAVFGEKGRLDLKNVKDFKKVLDSLDETSKEFIGKTFGRTWIGRSNINVLLDDMDSLSEKEIVADKDAKKLFESLKSFGMWDDSWNLEDKLTQISLIMQNIKKNIPDMSNFQMGFLQSSIYKYAGLDDQYAKQQGINEAVKDVLKTVGSKKSLDIKDKKIREQVAKKLADDFDKNSRNRSLTDDQQKASSKFYDIMVSKAENDIEKANEMINNVINSANDSLKGSGADSDKDKKGKDVEYEKWKKRVSIIKEAFQEYKNWSERVGKDNALKNVSEEFEKDFSELFTGKFQIDFKESFSSLEKFKELNRKTISDEWLEGLREESKIEAKKTGLKNENDVNIKIFDEESEKNLKAITKTVEDSNNLWSNFNSILSTTGDTALASRITGITNNPFESEAERLSSMLAESLAKTTRIKGAEDVEVGITDFLVKDEEELKEFINSTFGEGAKAILDLGNKFKQAKIKETADDLAILAKSMSALRGIASEIDRINEDYAKEQNRVDKMFVSKENKNGEKMTPEEYAKISKYLKADRDTKLFEKSSDFTVIQNATSFGYDTAKKSYDAYIEKLDGLPEDLKIQKIIDANKKLTDALNSPEATSSILGMSLDEKATFENSKLEAYAEKLKNATTDSERAEIQAKVVEITGKNTKGDINDIVNKIAENIKDTTSRKKLDKSTDDVIKAFSGLVSIASFLTDSLDKLGVEVGGIRGALEIMQGAISGAKSGKDGLSTLTDISGIFGKDNGIQQALGKAGPWAAAAGAVVGLASSAAANHDKRLENAINSLNEHITKLNNTMSNLETDKDRTLGGVSKVDLSSYVEAAKKDMDAAIKFSKQKDKSFAERGNNKSEGQRRYEAAEKVYNAALSGSYYDTMIALKEQELGDVQQQLANEKKKKDSDDANIEEFEQKIHELEVEIEDFYSKIASEDFGIDMKDWASQMGDALMSAWENGSSAAEAYEEVVRNVLKNTLKQMLTTAVIEPLMEPVKKFLQRDDVKDAMKAGEFTEVQIGELANILGTIGNDATNITNSLDKFNDMTKEMAGIDLKANSSSSSGSSIKNITEETADIIASYLNAMRLDLSVNRSYIVRMSEELLPSMNENLANQMVQLKLIEFNTATTAKNVESNGQKLDDMLALMKKVSTKSSGYGINMN